MTHETAQQAFTSLVNTVLSPGFRARGWTGSTGRYQLQSASHWVLAATQKSAFSDRDEVRFVVNLMVISRAEWAALRERRGGREVPSATQYPGSAAHWARLGQLASPVGEDVWWRLSPHTDLRETADAVLTALDAHGMPWIAERL